MMSTTATNTNMNTTKKKKTTANPYLKRRPSSQQSWTAAPVNNQARPAKSSAPTVPPLPLSSPPSSTLDPQSTTSTPRHFRPTPPVVSPSPANDSSPTTTTTTTTNHNPSTTSTATTATSNQKGNLTLKQKLKQDIANLKKKRQLFQLQQQALERRQHKEQLAKQKLQQRQQLQQQHQLQKEQKAQQRAKLIQHQQEQKRQKQLLRQQAQLRAHQEKEAKRQAKLAEQQRQQQEAIQHYHQAIDKYHQDAAQYRIQYAHWLQQQQVQQQQLQVQQQQQLQQQQQQQQLYPYYTYSAAASTAATTATVTTPAMAAPSHGYSFSSTPLLLPHSAVGPAMSSPFTAPSPLNSTVPSTPSVPSSCSALVTPSHSHPLHYSGYPYSYHISMSLPPTYRWNVIPPPIPPVPPKKPRCLLPKRPRHNTTKTNSTTTTVATLCRPLQSPSPFVHTYILMEQSVTLIKSESSTFGVNLRAYSTSILLDPPAHTIQSLQQQQQQQQEQQHSQLQQQQQQQQQHVKSTTTTTTTTTTRLGTTNTELVLPNTLPDATPTPTDTPTTQSLSVAEYFSNANSSADNNTTTGVGGTHTPATDTPTTQSFTDIVEHAPSSPCNHPVSEIDKATQNGITTSGDNVDETNNNPPSPVKSSLTLPLNNNNTNSDNNHMVQETLSHNNTPTVVSLEHESSAPQSLPVTSHQDSLDADTNVPKDMIPDPTPSHSQTPVASTTSIESSSFSSKASIPSSSTTTTNNNNNTTLSTDTATTTPAPPPRRRRRRRVNFTVMMVVDADKQNAQWNDRKNVTDQDHQEDAIVEPKLLLQPDDIILSVGGIELAGMSFEQACRVFAQQSVQVSETEQHATLTIARKKPPTKPVVISKPPTQIARRESGNKQPVSSSSAPSSLNKTTTKATSPPTEPTAGGSAKSTDSTPLQRATIIPIRTPNDSMEFNSTEIAVLADSVIQAIHQPSNRLLGQALSPEALQNTARLFQLVANVKDCILEHRKFETLQSKWSRVTQSIAVRMAERSHISWNNALMEETGNNKLESNLAFTSDAERTILRQLPRPTKGCRCKGQDHEYLHDVRCTLYRDVCRLLPAQELDKLQYNPNVASNSKTVVAEPKDLNTVETAYKDRIIKFKKASAMEDAEARFIARMEEVQVKEQRKAVLAPNLTSMVLSAVMELQREFPDVSPQAMEIDDDDDSDNDEMEVNDDDDEEQEHLKDEEELTLSNLGKRQVKGQTKTSSSKKRKSKDLQSLNLRYLIRMVQYIAKTWGHIYREPSHEDYAWRWEVFHGHNSVDSSWESSARNPRAPDTLSFEHVSSGINAYNIKATKRLVQASEAISKLEQAIHADLAQLQKCTVDENNNAERVSTVEPTTLTESTTTTAVPAQNQTKLEIESETADLLCLAAYLLSPTFSGLYDELLAFVKMGVLEISKTGIPTVTSDWASKVDIILLEDMENLWGTDVDPDGRCCIQLELRDALEAEWIKTNQGWSLSEDPGDVIFNLEVLDEWRGAFHGQMEGRANASEGIGRFGL